MALFNECMQSCATSCLTPPTLLEMAIFQQLEPMIVHLLEKLRVDGVARD